MNTELGQQVGAFLAAHHVMSLATMGSSGPNATRLLYACDGQAALGLKVSDEFTVPLCRGHHRQLHQAGDEYTWWNNLKINALEIAKRLWEESRTQTVRTVAQQQQAQTDPRHAPSQDASK